MVAYADFGYYCNDYSGALIPPGASGEFGRLAVEASVLLKYFTFGRIDANDPIDAVKDATCAIAEMLYKEQTKALDGREIRSENNDGYSVSYVTETQDGQTKEQTIRKKAYDITRMYLSDTGLLYAGLAPC